MADSPLIERVLEHVPLQGCQLYSRVIDEAAKALGVESRSVRAALIELAACRRILVDRRGGWDFVSRPESSTDYPLRARPRSRARQPRTRAA